MDKQHHDRGSSRLSRRSTVRSFAVGTVAAATALVGRNLAATAQDATPTDGACVATAPPAEDGMGFVSLLVGGIVHDMPSGPVEIRLSRFTLEPGTPFPPSPLPYPALMYIETGASHCPGGAGRIVYAADGTLLDETIGDGVQHIPTGTTQYIPAGVPDGAGNEGTELMSSLIIEFVPVDGGETLPTGTPVS